MAKKMILIDPRILDSITQKPYVPPDTLNDSLRELDAQMQEILNREDLSPRDKIRQYQQTLQRYTNRLTEYRHKPLGLVDTITPPPQIQRTDQQQEHLSTAPQDLKTEDIGEIPNSTNTSSKDSTKEIDLSPPAKRTRGKKSKIPTQVKRDVDNEPKNQSDRSTLTKSISGSSSKKSKIATPVRWDEWKQQKN